MLMLVSLEETIIKRIKPLTKEEKRTLLDASRYGPESRLRQRAHAPFI